MMTGAIIDLDQFVAGTVDDNRARGVATKTLNRGHSADIFWLGPGSERRACETARELPMNLKIFPDYAATSASFSKR